MSQKPSNAIANWLFIGAIMIAIIVVTGGITRLTHSGLSMVTWEPISGIVPPMNEADWTAEFENYQTSPEYKLKNSNFELEDFKSIFWWEYIHRVIARLIGLVFIFPFIFFFIRGKLKNKTLMRHLIVIFLLGAFQGFLGWFMVASGLVDKPEVNHYRLASHLLAALTVFGYIMWVGLHIRYSGVEADTTLRKSVRKILRVILGVLIVQIAYGAFMAGLKAGFFFPTFPKMGANWMPQNMDLIFNEGGLLAIMDNPFMVQFIHRWLPLIIIGAGLYLLIKTEKSPEISKRGKTIVRILNFIILIQVILGVYTILFSVPISLGVIHQFGALVLFTCVLLGLFVFRRRDLFLD